MFTVSCYTFHVALINFVSFNVALFLISLLMLHFFNISPIYVARFDVAPFADALSNVALCKCCTVLCSTILMFYHLILHCFYVVFF